MAQQPSKKQAEKIVNDNLQLIKRIIKKKIQIYDPLDVETTYQDFIKRVRQDEFRTIREFLGDCELEEFLNDLVKNFLIENAYYALAEKYIQRRIMNKLGILDPNEIRVLEIVDFITERLERNGMRKLKTFREDSKFKTFLSTVLSKLLMDFWREKYKIGKHFNKYGPEFDALFDSFLDDPPTWLIKLDDEELKDRAAKILPSIMERLDYKEKIAIKMKYEKAINVSEIANTLGKNHYKTRKLIKETEVKIKTELFEEIKNQGGQDDAYER